MSVNEGRVIDIHAVINILFDQATSRDPDEPVISLTGITAAYTQSGAVYPDTPLNDLKNDLVVTAVYSDESTETLQASDYTLTGALTVGTSVITAAYQGKTATFNVIVTEQPQSQYVFYDWLQGDGTAYIDTGLKANTYIKDTYQFYAKFANTVSVKEKVVFGARNRWGTTGIIVQSYIENSALKEQIAYANVFTYTDEFSTGTICEIELKDKKVYWNGNLIFTGSQATPTISDASQNIGLFCTSTAASGSATFDQKSPTKIYEFALKDSSGNYVAQMLPAKRRSDGVYGMYDTVREEFYVNSGESGTFIAGND